MAIFIVDQLSLNTDLPLDIRYVPNGGSYLDVSMYWYPGMQVYQTSDQRIWYADNSLNWHPFAIGGDIEPSINAIYNYLNDVSLRITNTDVSINNLYNNVIQIESSLGVLNIQVQGIDSSVGFLFGWNTAQDASIQSLRSSTQAIDASIVRLDASMQSLYQWQIVQDLSLSSITQIQGIHDASIGALSSAQAIHDSSIGVLTNWNIAQDVSIQNLESSLGLYLPLSGGAVTGNLTVDGSTLFNGPVVFKDNTFFDGSAYFVSVETIDVCSGFIKLNTGLTGTPPSNLQSGIIVGRGSSDPYVFLYDETDQTFRIGLARETSVGYNDASTQAVATRQDTPIIDGLAVWNSTLSRFDTFSSLVYNQQDGLSLDSSLNLGAYAGASNLSLVVGPDGYVKAVSTPDGSLNTLFLRLSIVESSIAALEASINSIINVNLSQDASILRIDSSISQLFNRVDTSVLGAINIGDGSAQVYAGLSPDGSLRFREITGAGAAQVSQQGDLVVISIDASFGGEVNTASNIPGGDASVFARKQGQDLVFRPIISSDPTQLIITNDSSYVYIDVSIAAISDASIGGLTDVSITNPLQTHQVLEYDASIVAWKNTNNLFWDISLGTTTDDIGGIPAGTVLNGMTLKDILYRLLYEYQAPIVYAGSNPIGGVYEKGIVSSQFSTIDVSYFGANTNYPLAKLSRLYITKTGSGTVLDTSLNGVDTSSGVFTDSLGITNWGGTNRTINYNVYLLDDQNKPEVMAQSSFTFYYKQFWGIVDPTLTASTITSSAILGVDSSRLTGESDLNATFTNSLGDFVKYMFAYPDTVAAPDNFGLLSEIRDQNGYYINDSFETQLKDVSIGSSNVRYRVYLLKKKVDTSVFSITFKF